MPSIGLVIPEIGFEILEFSENKISSRGEKGFSKSVLVLVTRAQRIYGWTESDLSYKMG